MPAPRLGRAFPSARFDYPSVSSLHLVDLRQYRNFYRLSIIYAFRPRLRSRLTPGGRTFPGKPQTLDGEVSRLSRYLCRHSLFYTVHDSFRYRFRPHRLLLYQYNKLYSRTSVSGFSPVNLPRTITRPVSYYALFERVAASKPTSWLFMQ